MNTKDEKKRTRQILLEEQQIAVEVLITATGSIQAAADYLDVSVDSINRWRKEGVLAQEITRQKLLDAAKNAATGTFRQELPIRKRGGSQPRYDLKSEERHDLESQLIILRLAPPEVRAATLKALLEKTKLSIPELARALGVHRNTLNDYLNPKYKRMMSLETASKIEEFERVTSSQSEPEGTPPARLQKALTTLLGEELVEKGFHARDWRRANAAEKIAAVSGLNVRTIRRYFPPLTINDRRLPLWVVEAFEKAAEQLGDVTGSGG